MRGYSRLRNTPENYAYAVDAFALVSPGIITSPSALFQILRGILTPGLDYFRSPL